MPEFDDRVARSTDSVLFWGEDRIALAVAATGLALRSGGPVTWVDVRDSGSRREAYEGIVQGALPRDRPRVALTPRQLAPGPEDGVPPVWSLIRSDEAEPSARTFGQFLQLPPAVQRLFAGLEPADRRPTLLLTNVDRVTSFYPEDVESGRERIGVFAAAGVKLVASLSDGPRADRFAFHHVFRIWNRTGESGTERTVLVLETAPAGPDGAGARVTPLREIPSLGRLLRYPAPPAGGGPPADRPLAAA